MHRHKLDSCIVQTPDSAEALPGKVVTSERAYLDSGASMTCVIVVSARAVVCCLSLEGLLDFSAGWTCQEACH